MGRLFVTGDCHGSYDYKKIMTFEQLIGYDLNRDDILAVMGDWGAVWYDGSRKFQGMNYNDYVVEAFWGKRKWTTFVVLGNHENYAEIAKYPIVNFCGAKAIKFSDNVYGAITGEVYNLNGHHCLTVNGADSHDRAFRTEGRDWWPQERISEDDMLKAMTAGYNWKEVDYILSHTGGSEVCSWFGYAPTISDERMDKILDSVKYKTHYCGHYHQDRFCENHRILYNDVIEIQEENK